jgi:hypothetical protein
MYKRQNSKVSKGFYLASSDQSRGSTILLLPSSVWSIVVGSSNLQHVMTGKGSFHRHVI